MGPERREKVYKWVKIGGILSFIPLVLAAGPIVGYISGYYLEKKFNLPSYISIICVTLGFAGSVIETVKIIKMALRTEGKS